MRCPHLLTYLCAFCLVCVAGWGASPPVNLILDTDMGNDIDDALALAMIHALEDRGEVKLLAVTVSKDNRFAAPFVNLVNTYYGRPDIPIGVVRSGKTPEDAPMIRVPSEMRNGAGQYVFPHRLTDGSRAPEAVSLLIQMLQAQADGSVTLAQIGFSTNLARLLQAPGGRELIRQKVKVLCLMGGNFVTPEAEYNIYTDPDSAATLLRDWPTPMVFSGFEIGLAITFPFEAYTAGFLAAGAHPIAAAAKAYFHQREDRAAWDPTAVLQAIRPGAGYFQLSGPGRITLGARNITVFSADPKGNSRYLVVSPSQASQIRQLLSDLVTEPPAQPGRR